MSPGSGGPPSPGGGGPSSPSSSPLIPVGNGDGPSLGVSDGYADTVGVEDGVSLGSPDGIADPDGINDDDGWDDGLSVFGSVKRLVYTYVGINWSEISSTPQHSATDVISPRIGKGGFPPNTTLALHSLFNAVVRTVVT